MTTRSGREKRPVRRRIFVPRQVFDLSTRAEGLFVFVMFIMLS